MVAFSRSLCVALLSFASLIGCKSAPPKMARGCDYELEILLGAGDVINPGDQGEALPVDIRIYQLRERTHIDTAEFAGVWKEDDKALGPDLLDKRMVTLYPGMSLESHFTPKVEAKFVAVAAIFRHPTARSWVRLYKLPPGDRKYFQEVNPERNTRCAIVSSWPIRVEGVALRYAGGLEDDSTRQGTR
jgi:type VI secretion system VasD/TssJ family lipoprotein